MIPFPDKKYDIIYADPAWDYEQRLVNKNRGRHTDNGAIDHYATMSIDDIIGLPVQSIASNDCLLFLWATSPRLPDCIKTGESWGFSYITVGFVWHKGIKPLMGNYTMSECEMCLVFKRGKIPQPRGKRNIRQFLSCKKGGHSVKPLEIKNRITEMFPTQSKIELFARPLPLFKQLSDDWDYWGSEV